MTLLTSPTTPARSGRTGRPATRTPFPRGRRTPTLAAWAAGVLRPVVETRRSRTLARVGGLVATLSLVAYLTWRVLATLPPSGPWRVAAWVLVGFEALPLLGSTAKLVSWWTIDAPAAPTVTVVPRGMRVALLIPTYNEPAEVVGPTIAAARELRAGARDLGARRRRPGLAGEPVPRSYGVRYVRREEHAHAKAGNLNHALALMAREEARGGGPPSTWSRCWTATTCRCPGSSPPRSATSRTTAPRWCRRPQAFFNGGAFDDDGFTGEQGLFFNVQLAARQHAGAGTFWCGSTSVLRVSALREVGGVAAETITEDMHTTSKLQQLGWRTAYHHQNLALGLAPATPEQYLVQRRRWGMGAMQVLVHEKLWRRQRWMSVRT